MHGLPPSPEAGHCLVPSLSQKNFQCRGSGSPWSLKKRLGGPIMNLWSWTTVYVRKEKCKGGGSLKGDPRKSVLISFRSTQLVIASTLNSRARLRQSLPKFVLFGLPKKATFASMGTGSSEQHAPYLAPTVIPNMCVLLTPPFCFLMLVPVLLSVLQQATVV